MLICNVNVVGQDGAKDICIRQDKIENVTTHTAPGDTIVNDLCLIFDEAIAFPGLINSHDHLEFNSFPGLANSVYNNYIEWARDIHAQNKEIINEVLKIPLNLRVAWGVYKNLLNGITTVVNHGNPLTIDEELIHVFQQYYYLHSVKFGRGWQRQLVNPRKWKYPYVIHIGEGTDEVSRKEINKFINWNFFKKNTIGVHAVAMTKKQAAHFAALVWCPVSNYFMLNKTADINQLKHTTKIVFGTDSTLTAGWNIWDHMRVARKEGIPDAALLEMLTTIPANVWKLSGRGMIGSGYEADLVIAKKLPGRKGLDAFFAINPEDILLVVHKGNIRLFDSVLYSQVTNTGFAMHNFSKINFLHSSKYVQGNLPALIEAVKSYCPGISFPIA
jgi:cytosine/adenosine deaminase-related metal-dependent hydrolase